MTADRRRAAEAEIRTRYAKRCATEVERYDHLTRPRRVLRDIARDKAWHDYVAGCLVIEVRYLDDTAEATAAFVAAMARHAAERDAELAALGEGGA